MISLEEMTGTDVFACRRLSKVRSQCTIASPQDFGPAARVSLERLGFCPA